MLSIKVLHYPLENRINKTSYFIGPTVCGKRQGDLGLQHLQIWMQRVLVNYMITKISYLYTI